MREIEVKGKVLGISRSGEVHEGYDVMQRKQRGL